MKFFSILQMRPEPILVIAFSVIFLLELKFKISLLDVKIVIGVLESDNFFNFLNLNPTQNLVHLNTVVKAQINNTINAKLTIKFNDYNIVSRNTFQFFR